MKTERGFTLIELLVVISIVALLIGILLPAIGKARDSAKVTMSLINLKQMGTAHATYASEWDGRQWTTCPDDLSVLASFWRHDYTRQMAPPVRLGFDRNGDHHETSLGAFIVPMWWPSNCAFGSFRLFNTKPFNNYINSKVYDKVFWAPKDYISTRRIAERIQDPGEFPAEDGAGVWFSTYCTSVAAMVSPDVYRGASRGGAQRAIDLAGGHRSPTLGSASYPDLKTHMLEHYWLQNNPSEYSIATLQWYFNQGPDSTPATLFYDGHTRLMGVREAVRSDIRVQQQGADSLVADDPGCFDTRGYYEWRAYNGATDEINSYHMFTRDGIKGRDTTGG